MKQLQKQLLFCLVVCGSFLLWQKAEAACTGESPTWTTDGNEQADLEECIAVASSGDTINVIAGSGVTTWSMINITKPLKIIGPGMDNLTVNFAPASAAEWQFYVIRASGIDDWRVSGFTFSPTNTTAGYVMSVRGSVDWRLDHNRFQSNGDNSFYVAFISANSSRESYGLIDSNIINNGRIWVNNAAANSAMWANLWHKDYPLGMAGQGQATYIEDNIFIATNADSPLNVVDSNYGSRYVARYNTVRATYFMAHTIQDTARASRTWEIYGNDMDDNIEGSITESAIFMRGGTGVIHNNNIKSTYNNAIKFSDDRSVYNDEIISPTENNLVTGKCDGDNRNDENLINTYTGYVDGWPCRDQIGRGADSSLWTTVNEAAGPSQASVPVYIWSVLDENSNVWKAVKSSDTNGDYTGSQYVVGLNEAHIKANRDYFDYNPSNTTGSAGTIGDNTTGGVGCGLARSATCEVGAAYFETSQSCSDISEKVGATIDNNRSGGTRNPLSIISGTLYKCTSTNAWTEYYTPYTYPHPLRTEASDIVAPASPSGLFVS